MRSAVQRSRSGNETLVRWLSRHCRRSGDRSKSRPRAAARGRSRCHQKSSDTQGRSMSFRSRLLAVVLVAPFAAFTASADTLAAPAPHKPEIPARRANFRAEPDDPPGHATSRKHGHRHLHEHGARRPSGADSGRQRLDREPRRRSRSKLCLDSTGKGSATWVVPSWHAANFQCARHERAARTDPLSWTTDTTRNPAPQRSSRDEWCCVAASCRSRPHSRLAPATPGYRKKSGLPTHRGLRVDRESRGPHSSTVARQ